VETKKARNWYWWLWLSPLLTMPTLLFLLFEADTGYEWICAGQRYDCNWEAAYRVTILVAVLGSALWHLVLLIPSLSRQSAFVRWHGRQALLLAGVRTAVPLALLQAVDDVWLGSVAIAIAILIPIWFGGTFWGQRQAARGNCSLMRWAGQGVLLSALQQAEEQAQVDEEAAGEPDPEALIETIRFSRDPEERRKALLKLDKLGMVERLKDERGGCDGTP
jgi:hypothetical protein